MLQQVEIAKVKQMYLKMWMQLKSINNLMVLCSRDPIHLSKTFAAASWFIRAASNSGCHSSGPLDALEGSSTPSSMWEQQWRL